MTHARMTHARQLLLLLIAASIATTAIAQPRRRSTTAKVLTTGLVIDAAGEAVPDADVHLATTSRSTVTRTGADGTFSVAVDYDMRIPLQVTVLAVADGFALRPRTIEDATQRTLTPEQRDANPQGATSAVDCGGIVLQPAVPGTLRIRDDATGEPIAGVKVRYIGVPMTEFRKAYISLNGSQPLVSDGDGTISLPDVSVGKAVFSAVRPGYSDRLGPDPTTAVDGVFDITMTPAPPVHGRLLSDADSEPIAGAQVMRYRVRYEQNGLPTWQTSDPRQGRSPLATTDADGRFTLDRLAADATYDLMVLADGYRPALLTDIRLSAGPHTLPPTRLLPGRILRGRVVGDLSKLPLRDGVRSLPYTNAIRVETDDRLTTTRSTLHTPVDEHGRFTIEHIVGHAVTLRPPGREPVPVVLNKSLDYELKLTDEAQDE